jgi:hypothetical protein
VKEYRQDLEWEKSNNIKSVPLANLNPLQFIRGRSKSKGKSKNN